MQVGRPADTPVGRPIPGCLCLNTVSVCLGETAFPSVFPSLKLG